MSKIDKYGKQFIGNKSSKKSEKSFWEEAEERLKSWKKRAEDEYASVQAQKKILENINWNINNLNWTNSANNPQNAQGNWNKYNFTTTTWTPPSSISNIQPVLPDWDKAFSDALKQYTGGRYFLKSDDGVHFPCSMT